MELTREQNAAREVKEPVRAKDFSQIMCRGMLHVAYLAFGCTHMGDMDDALHIPISLPNNVPEAPFLFTPCHVISCHIIAISPLDVTRSSLAQNT